MPTSRNVGNYRARPRPLREVQTPTKAFDITGTAKAQERLAAIRQARHAGRWRDALPHIALSSQYDDWRTLGYPNRGAYCQAIPISNGYFTQLDLIAKAGTGHLEGSVATCHHYALIVYRRTPRQAKPGGRRRTGYCQGCGDPASVKGEWCAKCYTDFAKPNRIVLNRRRRSALTTSTWRKLREHVMTIHLERYGLVCRGWLCEPHRADDLVVDHIHPIARGGAPLDEDNLQILCRACNSRKWAHISERDAAECPVVRPEDAA